MCVSGWMNSLTLKALMANSKRSLHVVIAVALSVGLIFSSFTVAEGLVSRMTQMTEGYTVTDLFYIIESASSLSNSEVGPWVLGLIPEDVEASPIVKTYVTLPSQEMEIEVWGVDREAFVKVRQPWIKGSWPSEPDEVMVGVGLSERYGILEGNIIDFVGEEGLRSLTVTGVFKTGSQYDEGLLTSMDFVEEVKNSQKGFSMIELRVSNLGAFSNVLDLIEGSGLRVIPSKGIEDYLSELGEEVRLDLFMFSGVVAFIVLIFVSHTLYKVLSDSSNEIIILRMIGVTRSGLAIAVLIDSVLLSLLGALLGLFLGLLLSSGLAISVFLFLGGSYIFLGFDVSIACYSVLSSILVGLLGGIFSILLRRPYGEPYGSGELL